MALAQQARLNTAKGDEQGHDARIMFGYSILAILLLVAIYSASAGPGTAPDDFANMSVFP